MAWRMFASGLILGLKVNFVSTQTREEAQFGWNANHFVLRFAKGTEKPVKFS
jgi:hypothetical protein